MAERSQAFTLPAVRNERVWYRYAVEMVGRGADDVILGLRNRGIHAERPVIDWRTAGMPPCPVADRAYRNLVSLPLYPTLQPEEQDRVCRALEQVIDEL